MKADDLNKLSGADLLRRVVGNINDTTESFNQRFSAPELVMIGRMLLLCEWDIMPDRWAPRQVREALKGVVPRFDENEQPTYASEKEGA